MTLRELAAEMDQLRARSEQGLSLSREEHKRLVELLRLFREADTLPEIPAARERDDDGR